MAKFERGRGTSLMVVPQSVEPKTEKLPKKERMLRYSMPLEALDNVQVAGLVASNRLLDMLQDQQTFEGLSPQAKLKAIELAMTQAFGRADSALQEEKVRQPEGRESEVVLKKELMRLGKLVELPEMRKTEKK